jgi:hypothetical protein
MRNDKFNHLINILTLIKLRLQLEYKNLVKLMVRTAWSVLRLENV